MPHPTLLECDYIAYHPTVFRRLAKLSHLTRLRIGWSAECLWPEFGPPLPVSEDHFSKLKSLCLGGTSTVLLDALNSVRCNLIELDVGITLTKLDERHGLTSLAANIQASYSNLRELQCRVTDASERDAGNMHRPALLGSFLSLKHLERFGFLYTTMQAEQEQLLQLGTRIS